MGVFGVHMYVFGVAARELSGVYACAFAHVGAFACAQVVYFGCAYVVFFGVHKYVFLGMRLLLFWGIPNGVCFGYAHAGVVWYACFSFFGMRKVSIF